MYTHPNPIRSPNTVSDLNPDSNVQPGRNSALEVFLNDMRYINPRFTYLLLLTYLIAEPLVQRGCIYLTLRRI